ncbi:MAG: hypothetical protein HQK79_19415 [Desulfobacterales bacterium]|nr:hypothetical protein [Desulfobacterales bacterium]MBF0396934.1 hypothetical protein [Desulfobacterales bacterium]
MSVLPIQIDMLRYLIVLQINDSLVASPTFLTQEFSIVLGTIISNNLPPSDSSSWKQEVSVWDEYGGISIIGKKSIIKQLPEAKWPIESVLFLYPYKKRSYGEGELILLEIKLIGKDASHDFFVNYILPAIEEAGSVIDTTWQPAKSLWGRFDIHSVHIARGNKWEPLFADGMLDLEYKPTTSQWAEGLNFDMHDQPLPIDSISWLTPFIKLAQREDNESLYKPYIPSLTDVFDAFISRINSITPGCKMIEDQSLLLKAIMDVPIISVTKTNFNDIYKPLKGDKIGTQIFNAAIPSSVFPYLRLASIIQIGRYTHFGCGAFIMQSSSCIKNRSKV